MRDLSLAIGVAFLFGIGCNGSGSTTATSGGALLCIPGEQKACPCPHGIQGAQACLEDGSGYGICQGCGAGGGASATSSTGSMSTTGSGGAGGMGSTSTATASGGAGGVASTSTTMGSGGTGGVGSTSTATASGGAGGMASTSTTTGSGGTGGMASTSIATGSGGTGGMGSTSMSTGSGGDAGTPVCNVPGNCVHKISLPETSQSSGGITCTLCPGGPDENGNPPKCILELDLGNAALNLMAAATDGGPPQVSADGTIPMRMQYLPLTCTYLGIPFDSILAINGNLACPPNPQQFANVSVQAMLAVNDGTPIGSLRVGCSALTSITVNVSSADLSNAMQVCQSPSPSVTNVLKSLFISSFAQIIELGVKQAIDGKVCASP